MSPRSSNEVGRGLREPAVAGMFYPVDAVECRRAAIEFVKPRAPVGSEKRWLGGIVPHAGWICSAAIAGQTIAALAAGGAVEVVVVFGAVHTAERLNHAALDSSAGWLTPGDRTDLPLELERRLIERSELFAVDERFHVREHAVEVEVPLIRAAYPTASVLPVEVPLCDDAMAVGVATARAVAAAKQSAVYLASSDLTHYGPAYGFTPAGVGLGGLQWGLDNDRRLLELVAGLATERIVAEVRARLNACGGGAIAAMMAACRESGASVGTVLAHANSYQTLAGIAPQPPENGVGYASVVIG